MILCLDAGNSRLKFGVFDGGHWLLQDALAACVEIGVDARTASAPLPKQIVVVEDTPLVHNVIVCTLCSCYPLVRTGTRFRRGC